MYSYYRQVNNLVTFNKSTVCLLLCCRRCCFVHVFIFDLFNELTNYVHTKVVEQTL